MKKQKVKTKKSDAAMRSVCPIACTLDLIGDKWSLLVIRDLILGKKTYREFQESPEGIPTNILAERLKRLELHGIVEKHPYQERPVRYAYELTKKGKALGPIVSEILKWGLKYIPGTQAKMLKGSR
ncbi:winged helix-turn-helix transcriptional regulator [Kaarinaea lacus]